MHGNPELHGAKHTVGRLGETVNKPLRNLDIGDKVTVFYNSQNVSRVRIKGYDNTIGPVIGIAAMILGIIIPLGIIKGTWNN